MTEPQSVRLGARGMTALTHFFKGWRKCNQSCQVVLKYCFKSVKNALKPNDITVVNVKALNCHWSNYKNILFKVTIVS